MMTERPVAGEPSMSGPVLVPPQQPLMRDLARRDFADTDQLCGHVGQSGPDRFGVVADGLPGQALTRVGITVSAPFGEELDNRVGVATVPGLVVASYDFDRIE